MKRKIIEINGSLCNGCGLCVDTCAEAALKIIDGKAKLTKEFFCDGMGFCLDVCPVGALKIVEKDADEYNVGKTFEHVKKTRGENKAQKVHGIEEIIKKEKEDFSSTKCGCPSSMMRSFDTKVDENVPIAQKSQLQQWPIQLHLLMPQAPYFKNADLLICADCVPFSFANFHERFLKGKKLIMLCPKLDHSLNEYTEKLAEIFKIQDIQSITIVHMEVPCCSGVELIVKKSLEKADKNIIIKDYTISIQGEII